MSDFRYLDYEGLATYTEHVKEYADGKIVYISDESEIPNPPKEGTLYVIGSEILMDEEIIIGTQTASTSSWTGKSIDTRLHDGKRIAYYLPYPSINGTPSTLTLELSDEDNTTTPPIRIIAEGGYFNKVIPGGSVIRMTYFENIVMNGTPRGGWICDGNIIQNNVTFTGNPVDEQVATFEGTTGTIKASGYTIAKSVPSDAKFTDTVYTHPTTAGNKHIPTGGSANQYLKYSSSGTAVWAEPEYQFCDYGNLYTGGTAVPRLPTTLQLSGNVKFINGGRLVVKFNNNYGQDLSIVNNGLSAITFPDSTSMTLTYDVNRSAGYAETHIGNHYLDIIMYTIDDNTKYGYITGYSVPYANQANNATSATSADYASYSNVVYATSATSAGTSSKVATISGNTNFKLVTGAVAYVRFTYANTSPTLSLNVGSTGAKTIRYRSSVYNTQTAQYPSWTAGDTVQFVYTGTYWDIVAPTITMKTSSSS